MSTPKCKIMQLSVIITADQTLTLGRAPGALLPNVKPYSSLFIGLSEGYFYIAK
jgi:hypothetical protein